VLGAAARYHKEEGMEKIARLEFTSADAIEELSTCDEIVLPQQVLSKGGIISAATYKEALTMLAAICQIRRGESIDARDFWFSSGHASYRVDVRAERIYVVKEPTKETDRQSLWNDLIACFSEVKGCITGLHREQYGDFQIQLFGALEVGREASNTPGIRLGGWSRRRDEALTLTVDTFLAFIERVERAFSFPGEVTRNEWEVDIDFFRREEILATLSLKGNYFDPEVEEKLTALRALRGGFATTAKVSIPTAVEEEAAQG
jgi:hypothetical protein